MDKKFIVVEGIDGSGKSTLVENLFQSLQRQKIPIAKYTEPTQYHTGLYIRKFLKNEISLSKNEQLNAFVEDRKVSLNNNILPSLKSGKHVLLDRYFYSTCTYQASEEYPPQKILKLNLEQNFLVPDAVIYLDISPEKALERIQSRNEKKEYFETLTFLNKIYNAYKEVLPEQTLTIDGTLEKKELVKLVEEKLKKII